MNYYSPNDRFILFISTVLVLGYLIFTLIRRVRTLLQLGRMGNKLHKIQDAAEDCPVADCLAIKPIDEGEWIRDAFAPIARDGAGVLEVNLVMQGVTYSRKNS